MFGVKYVSGKIFQFVKCILYLSASVGIEKKNYLTHLSIQNQGMVKDHINERMTLL